MQRPAVADWWRSPAVCNDAAASPLPVHKICRVSLTLVKLEKVREGLQYLEDPIGYCYVYKLAMSKCAVASRTPNIKPVNISKRFAFMTASDYTCG